MVVLDAEHGPIYIDEGAEIHPFTRIEGPCYIGRKSILLGGQVPRGKLASGPMCRIGGEVEESIIQGYSNKYHDGFLGHAYVGEWVNLGALTTNSDLKNDYSNVSVVLDGRTPDRHRLDQGRLPDRRPRQDLDRHAAEHGRLRGGHDGDRRHGQAAAEVHPSVSPGSWRARSARVLARRRLYATAKIAMGRRKCQWTPEDQALWEAVFQMTAPERDEAIAKARRQHASRSR